MAEAQKVSRSVQDSFFWLKGTKATGDSATPGTPVSELAAKLSPFRASHFVSALTQSPNRSLELSHGHLAKVGDQSAHKVLHSA